MKYRKFETLYKRAKERSNYKNLDNLGFYKSFMIEINLEFKIADFNKPLNIWIYEQNELKNNHNGKQTLKRLCLNYFTKIELDHLNQL